MPTPEVYADVASLLACCAALPSCSATATTSSSSPTAARPAAACWSSPAATAQATCRHNGELLALDDLRQHLSDILSGMYSLGGQPDAALVQQRVRLHPAFEAISYKGIPDIRVILYRNEPAMAMLRLPTKESGGRANLHQGGIGTGVDLETGVTHHAVQRNRFVAAHPDTGRPVVGMQVPYWDEVLEMSRRCREAVGPGLHRRGHRRRRATAGRCCWRRTPGRGWPSRSPTARGWLPRLEAIDEMLARNRPLPNGRHPKKEEPLRQAA